MWGFAPTPTLKYTDIYLLLLVMLVMLEKEIIFTELVGCISKVKECELALAALLVISILLDLKEDKGKNNFFII